MPRVPSQPTFLILCGASVALAACAGGSAPSLGVDLGSAVLPDDQEGGGAPVEPIDGPEQLPLTCQSQFFGADPLSPAPSARSCSFALTSAVLNPGNVLVEIAGQARAPGDAEDGWLLLPDGITVQLLGIACDEVLAGADVKLSALCE